MIIISRHKFGSLEPEFYAKKLEKKFSNLENKVIPAYKVNTEKFNLGTIVFHTLKDISEYSLLSERDQDRKLQTEVLVLWQDISKAFYNLAYGAGNKVTINLQGENVEHDGVLYTSNMGFGDWLKAYSAFKVLRDREGLEILNNITESSMERSELKWNKMEKNMLLFFSNVDHLSFSELEKLLITAIKSTSPDSGDFEANLVAVEYNMYIYEALLWVYNAVFSGDAEDFNKQLVEALNRYKQFYDKEVRNRIADGWMNWLLLAIDYDQGMEIKVQSDYIPEWLYKGVFDLSVISRRDRWS